MNYALKHLRQELNRERSFVSQYQFAVSRGVEVGQTRTNEVNTRLRQNRIAALQMAIAALKQKPKSKKVKPAYYWTPKKEVL